MNKTKNMIKELYTMVDEMAFGAKLYAIADAGIYRDLIDILEIEDPEYRILFKDAFVQEYEDVAPYIIELDRDDAWVEQLIAKGYGQRWLTFVLSHQDVDTLALELRERINIYSQKHEREVIFRFYDPRNLERYFKLLTEEEIQELFINLDGAFAYVDLEDDTKLNIYTSDVKEVKLVKEDNL